MRAGNNGTLYIGVTSALVQRVWQHKTKAVAGFTARYGVDQLVYFEAHGDAASAIRREKQLKKWRRAEAERRGVPMQVVLPVVALKHLQVHGGDDLESVPQLGGKRIRQYGEKLTELATSLP